MLITIYGLCVLTGARERSLKGSPLYRYLALHITLMLAPLKSIQGERKRRMCRSQNMLFGWSNDGTSPCAKWLDSHWKHKQESIKTSTLWHFYVRNPFAIDRSPINQQRCKLFFLSVSPFVLFLNLLQHTKKKTRHIKTSKTATKKKELQSLSNDVNSETGRAKSSFLNNKLKD